MRTVVDVINDRVGINNTVLDIGCGNKIIHKSITYKSITTVDAWEKVSPDYLIDLERETLPFEENSFDVVFLLDFIEHLDKSTGQIVIEDCIRISRKLVILFTPIIWDDNHDNTNNPNCWAYGNKYNNHKSLWTDDDFKYPWSRYTNVENRLITKYWFGEYNVTNTTINTVDNIS